MRSVVRAQTPEEMGGLTVKLGWGSTPVLLREVATRQPRWRASPHGRGHIGRRGSRVLGTALMLPGENGRVVARRVEATLARKSGSGCPPGWNCASLYDRSTLVDDVLHTVRSNLLEGACLVVLLHLICSWATGAGR